MANGQRQSKKEQNGKNGTSGSIIPIDRKTTQVQGKTIRLPAPIVDTQKEIDNELNALDKKPIAELIEAAIYSTIKEVREKALGLVAKEKNIGALKSILYHPGLQDPESEVIALIDSLTNPKPTTPDAGSSSNPIPLFSLLTPL